MAKGTGLFTSPWWSPGTWDMAMFPEAWQVRQASLPVMGWGMGAGRAAGAGAVGGAGVGAVGPGVTAGAGVGTGAASPDKVGAGGGGIVPVGASLIV